MSKLKINLRHYVIFLLLCFHIKTLTMAKRFLLLSGVLCAVALVSSPSNVTAKENDSGFQELKQSAVQAPVVFELHDYKKNFDVALNDALVPVVPLSPTVHASYCRHVADGHTPDPLAVVRGPTKEVTNYLTPRTRDKPIC